MSALGSLASGYDSASSSDDSDNEKEDSNRKEERLLHLKVSSERFKIRWVELQLYISLKKCVFGCLGYLIDPERQGLNCLLWPGM